MKVHNITDIDKFFGVIDSCVGRVELVTAEGDRLNLKSTLCKYVALAKVFSDGTIPSLELVVYESEDIGRLVDYMMYCNAKQSISQKNESKTYQKKKDYLLIIGMQSMMECYQKVKFIALARVALKRQEIKDIEDITIMVIIILLITGNIQI